MAFPVGWDRSTALLAKQVDAALTNFPILLTQANLPSEMLGTTSTAALNGGGDLRFSSDAEGATPLPCEVVSFVTNADPALGTAEVWVKLPSLSASGPTTFYAWWNKAGEVQPVATDPAGRNAVWETDTKGVWHLSQDPSGTAPQITDSTSNANNGTTNGAMTSGQSVAGRIGNALSFDGSNDYVALGSNSALAPTDKFSLSFWAKFNATADQIILGRTKVGANGWGVWTTSSKVTVYLSTNGTNYLYTFNIGSTLDVGNWHHYAFSFDKTGYVSKTPPSQYKETHGSSIVSGGKLWCIGGYGTPGTFGTSYSSQLIINPVKYYDPATDAWTTKSATSFTARWGAAIAEYDGEFFLFGGQDPTLSTAITTVQAYDIAGNTWRTCATALPAGLNAAGAHVAVTFGSKIYVLGSNTMYEYDPVADTWTTKAVSASSGINTWATCVTDGTYIYCIGGYNGAKGYIRRYDPTADTWSDTFATLPAPNWACVAAYDATSGNIYLGLGRNTPLEQESRWYKWDRSSGTGGFTQLATDSAPGNALYHGVIDRKFYVFGVRFFETSEIQDDGQYGGCFDLATEAHLTQATYLTVYRDNVKQFRVAFAQSLNVPAASAEFGNQDSYHAGLWLNGAIDEVRLAKVGRTAAWIDAEYDAVTSPETFVTTPPFNPVWAAAANPQIIGA